MTNPNRSTRSDVESLAAEPDGLRLPRPQIVRTNSSARPVVRPVASLTPASPRTDGVPPLGLVRAVRPSSRRPPTVTARSPKLAAVLSEWRRAEQLTDALPAAAPDHETAMLLVAQLRSLYGELTSEAKPRTAEAIASSQRTIRRARRVLDAITVKAAQRRATDGASKP